MQFKSGFFFLSVVLWAFFAQASVAGSVYSYVDDSGIKVYSTAPPVEQVEDMKVTGEEPTPAPAPPASKATSFDGIIEKYAGDYQLDPSLIRSIISQESGFNHKAVSPKGARGLMQLMPATAERLGVRNSFDPEENIRGGVKHFRSLMDSFNNNLDLSLAAYNAGENLVRRLGRIPDFKETKEYVQSIKKKYGRNETAQLPAENQPPPLYRFVDEAGVLHLTNISPLR